MVIGDHVTVNQYFRPLGETPTTQEEPTPGDPPYMGLHYFDTTDAGLFFGRAALSQKLVARLVIERFLAIVGASGSGKSSVARAGLVPLWQAGIPIPASTYTGSRVLCGRVHVITPTAHPLQSLAASLTRQSESVTAATTLMDDLAKDLRSLHLYICRLMSGTDAHLLLLVDQFEETFTMCKDPGERQAFVENLLIAASEESAGPLRVVITLRADFYHHCAEYEALRKALDQHQTYIGAMNLAELRQAIEDPARMAAPESGGPWVFEPGLVDLILQDVGAEPGALPLLSHALLETWKRRQGRTMTLAGYADVGGVRKAIAQTAGDVYTWLTPEAQAIARTLFLRLTIRSPALSIPQKPAPFRPPRRSTSR